MVATRQVAAIRQVGAIRQAGATRQVDAIRQATAAMVDATVAATTAATVVPTVVATVDATVTIAVVKLNFYSYKRRLFSSFISTFWPVDLSALNGQFHFCVIVYKLNWVSILVTSKLK